MALVGNFSGSNAHGNGGGIAYITGALHLSSSGNGGEEDSYPYIAIEPTSGNLAAVGGVTDKLHNRAGVLYFGSVNLQSGGGVDAANGANNRIATFTDSDSLNGEANLQFDGNHLTVASTGKLGLGSNGTISSFINSPMSGGLLLSASAGIVMSNVVSGAAYTYMTTGLFTSGHVLATGSVTGKSGVVSNGTISGSSTLQIVGASTLIGNASLSGNLIMGSTTITETEIGYLDGLTLGTVAAAKAVTADSNKDISGHRNLSGSGGFQSVGNAIIGGTLNVSGNADFNGTITCDDSITIDSITITDTELGYLDGLTLGTVAASKVVTVDSDKDVGDFRNVTATGLLTVASITASMGIMPDDDNTQDLGSSAKRWRNIYTGDLHLANDRGNWTVIEDPDFLSLRNNKTGQRFKLEMTLLDPSDGNYGPGNDGKL